MSGPIPARSVSVPAAPGSSGRVATVVLSQKSDAELTFVAFKDGSEVQATFQEKRIPRLTDVPTAREAGYDRVAARSIDLVG